MRLATFSPQFGPAFAPRTLPALAHKASGVLIDEGLKICRLDKLMLRSVRDRSQSDPRNLEVFDQLRFGVYCDRRAKLFSALPDREVEVLISQPDRLPGENFNRLFIKQVKKKLPIVLKCCLHIVRQS